MSVVEYLVILNATRSCKDGLSEVRGFYKDVLPFEEGTTRNTILTTCQDTLDVAFFRKRYGDHVDYNEPATINFWYCEPNQLG